MIVSRTGADPVASALRTRRSAVDLTGLAVRQSRYWNRTSLSPGSWRVSVTLPDALTMLALRDKLYQLPARLSSCLPRVPPRNWTGITRLGGRHIIHCASGTSLGYQGSGVPAPERTRPNWNCGDMAALFAEVLLPYTAPESNWHSPLRRRMCCPLHQRCVSLVPACVAPKGDDP